MKYLVGNRVINADNITFVSKTSSGMVKIYFTASDETWLELPGDEADCFWKVYSADAMDVMDAEA